MQDSLIGKTLGEYRVVARIAKGGMATVYRGVDETTGSEVAIKVLLPAYSHDDEFVRRFQREARATIGLDHPNVIRVYDAGEADGYYYLVMEYVPQGSLKDLLQELRTQGRSIEVAKALDITRQVAQALAYIHRRGIIHRDIKPSNILLAGDRAILTDLGIAKAITGTQLTRTMMSPGTPEYMSPEQGGSKELDGRTDIYSLGVVLYEILTGTVPFKADTPLAVLVQHVYETPPPIEQYNPGLSPQIRAIVRRAMAKDRKDRYPTAAAMAKAIDRVMDSFAPTPEPPTVQVPVVQAGVDDRTVQRRVVPPRHTSAEQRHSIMPFVLASLAIVVVLSAVFVFGRGMGGTGRPANGNNTVVVVQPSRTQPAGEETTVHRTLTATQTLAGKHTAMPPAASTHTRTRMTPTSTATPTSTSTGTATPAHTASPTVTRTRAPTPTLTQIPTNTPTPVPAIQLVNPATGTTVRNCVDFEWSARDLNPGEFYDLRVCQGESCMPRYGISHDPPPVTWGPRDTRGNRDLRGSEGVYRWQVVIVGTSLPGEEPRSNTGQFEWAGGSCGSGPTAPTREAPGPTRESPTPVPPTRQPPPTRYP